MRMSVYRHLDGRATVGYIEEGKTVEVIPCKDWVWGEPRTFYRIDFEGRTIDTLIHTKNDAIARAKRHAAALYRHQPERKLS